MSMQEDSAQKNDMQHEVDLTQLLDEDLAKFRELQSNNFQDVSIIKNIPTIFQISKISEINIFHQIVLLKGTVIRTSISKSIYEWVEFQCQQCQATFKIYSQPENYFICQQPKKCSQKIMKFIKPNPYFKKNNYQKFKKLPCNGTSFTQISQSSLIDYQEIKLQDAYSILQPGMISNTINVMLKGDQVNAFKIGDNIIVGGILVKRWKILGQKPQISLWIDCKNIQHLKQNEQQKLLIQIKSTNYIELRSQILYQFAPEVHQLWDIKLGILLSLIGSQYSREDEQTNVRKDSHFLLVGECGTGKSTLLRYISSIVSKAIYINGVGASQAGMTVSFFKEDKDWMIEAGALVLSDKGVCCIDDLNLMPINLQQSLLEVLEQQNVSSSKAGIITKLSARSTIIASCSPQAQFYDSQLSVSENVGLSTPLLSRFDLIMIMKDKHDLDLDKDLCQHLLFSNKLQNSNVFIKNYLENLIQLKDPIIGEEYFQAIGSYYSLLRKKYPQVTVRQMEGLIRLCKAHAKLCQRDQVNKFDLVSVIALNECQFQTGVFENYQEILMPQSVNEQSVEKMWLAISNNA